MVKSRMSASNTRGASPRALALRRRPSSIGAWTSSPSMSTPASSVGSSTRPVPQPTSSTGPLARCAAAT
ncbi:MAG: hypothetical protein A2V63_02780 [Candidatus Eisenbacteria bacterium RBG_19FT_COMBO_70_11]|nr:MAG: hypothetical protein A2V63_02780 [Candidatus Eisenbacteria bacterium RBG_19FT_COMBO_70_11]